ncbi:hypothetical protein FSP39_017044 [Pinctada imbricata]|uniref:Transglutaminase-like domain-containing protein n=1 Tax=Pinctada imbricata TaxID=66713 RepID=A0AA89BPH6_PINIB|nr:hypothetical protein FSP39_017044 [Pinctada imbricata]
MDGARSGDGRRRSDGESGDDAKPISLAEHLRRNGRMVDEPYGDLQTVYVDLMINENSTNHNTDKYTEDIDSDNRPLSRFVVRRGFPFHIKILFTRPFNLEKDRLKLVFTTGENPLPGDRTFVSLIPSKPESHGNWGAEILGGSENELTVAIQTPPDCIVSKWNLEVQILEETETDVITHTNSKIFPMDIYILFNPWNKTDTVFLESDECREEYVLNDEGNVWVGDRYNGKDWSFKQFDKDILECTLLLLDQCYLRMKNRGNPVLVTRALSEVGSTALQGNWSGNYEGGTPPFKWNGSAKILQEYFKTRTTVMFGQCWVFSGILTTMCRALGIPCRSVTNFSSAHDTDGSITIDEYLTLTGEEIKGGDSVWNFHVWNEAWMDRPDLPKEKKYGGWQAIDCTPQEMSDGRYQCGPMSVEAIKAGDVAFSYDGPFIFGEVNADRVTWMYDNYGEKYLVDIETNSIGTDISTRAIPKEDENTFWWFYSNREDLTDSYKYREGSEKEKGARIAANLTTADKTLYTIPDKKASRILFPSVCYITPDKKASRILFPIKFFLERTKDHNYGDDFVVKLRARNTVKDKQSIHGYITIKSSDYRGKPKKILKSQPCKATIAAGKDEEFEVAIKEEDYRGKLAEGCYISIVCCFITEEVKQGSISKDLVRLRKPKLNLEVMDKEVEKGKPFSVRMSFTNPLKIALTDCDIDIEGSGIEVIDETRDGVRRRPASDAELKQPDVRPNDRFETEIKVVATKTGKRKMLAAFNAFEINDTPIYNKGGDLQQHQAAAPTAKPQNTKCKIIEQTSTEKDTKGTGNVNAQHRNIKHKGLHKTQREQSATGADLGQLSAMDIAEGVVILDASNQSAFHKPPKLISLAKKPLKY